MSAISNDDEIRKVLIQKLIHELPVLRARLGATQADIAERIGISRQTYNSIETLKREMNWTTFVALIAVFQNNQETRRMLNSIENFEREIGNIMSVQEQTERI